MRHEEPLALHPLAQRFASVADVYDRGRPDYPPAAVGALAAELKLSPGAPVLDLGAGTGKLSRALLAYGLDVVAVEPLPELRGLLAGQLGADRVHEGTRVPASQRAEPERIVDYLSSISWIAAMPHEQREASIGRIRALVTHGETPSEMPVHFVIGLTSLAPPAP